jgi:WD40 repeat protein
MCGSSSGDTRDSGALLRGGELVELMAAALAGAPGRMPQLTEEQRAYLSESQRHEEAERQRVEGLYWDAQARGVAFAARERGEAQPDLALLLSAEGVAVAHVPEARAVLFDLLDRYASLSGVLRGHAVNRSVSGLAFSPDGRWLASIDEAAAVGDDRPSRLLVHELASGRTIKSVESDESLRALAWGSRWLACASRGSIGWLRYDDWKERFLGNTPTALEGDVLPEHLAFSPPESELEHDWLAWGTQSGDLGLVRVADHARRQIQLGDSRSSEALTGLAWLPDGRLLTAEHGHLLIRSVPELEVTARIAALGKIYALATEGDEWVVSFNDGQRVGLLFGKGVEVKDFQRVSREGQGRAVALAASMVLAGSARRRTGVPAVELLAGIDRTVLLAGEDQLISRLALSRDARFAAAGERRGGVWLWDRARRSHLVVDAGLGRAVTTIAVSNDGTIVAAADAEPSLLQMVATGLAPVLAERPLPFALDRLLVTGSELLGVSKTRGLVRIARDRTELLALPEGLSATMVEVAAEASLLAVRASEHAIAILRLDAQDLVQVRVLEVGGRVVAFTLDRLGRYLYVLSDQLVGVVARYALNAPEQNPIELARISLPLGPAAMAPALEEGGLLLADDDDLVLIGGDGTEVRAGGHDEPIKRIVVSPKTIASIACSYRDQAQVDAVRLWSAAGRPTGVVTLPEHTADAAFTTDESALLVLGLSGTLYRVSLSTERAAAAARGIANRPLTTEEIRRYGLASLESGPR